MDVRKTLIIFILLVFTFSVSAQTPFNEIIGSQMTVGESLVSFVNATTTFNLNTPAEVFLYVIAPLIGFYFLIKNFLAMGYEMFEDRIDRPEFEKYEDLPNGFKAFAMATSAITILTLGAAGAGLLLFAGLASALLAALMFAGLFTTNGENGSSPSPQPQTRSSDTEDTSPSSGSQNNLADTLDNASDLMRNAQDLAQNLEDRSQKQDLSQLQNSLQYFENDIVEEMKNLQDNHSTIDNLISSAENEMTDHNDFHPDTFKNLSQRAARTTKFLNEMKAAMRADFSSSSNPSFPKSNLESFLTSNSDRDPKSEVFGIEGQIDRILTSGSVTPPDDVFNDILGRMGSVVATGHFMNHCPSTMNELATDKEACEKVIMVAASMNKIQDVPGRDEASKLMNLASWLDSRAHIAENLIKRSENLCKKEMQVSKAEMKNLKQLVGKDEKMHELLKFLSSNASSYNNMPTKLSNDLIRAEHKMQDIDNKIVSIESNVSKHGKYESSIYEKLKELEAKIS